MGQGKEMQPQMLNPDTDQTVPELIGLPESFMQQPACDMPPAAAPQVPAAPSAPAAIAYGSAEVRDLRAEVERLRAERDRLLETQKRVLELIGSERPERLVHDLRNVLNERALYRALAETVM
jgi:hypothetical protein